MSRKAPTIPPQLNTSDAAQSGASWMLLRSIWTGLLLGLLPVNSGLFWFALLIPAVIPMRLWLVAVVGAIGHYAQPLLDPIAEPLGQSILTQFVAHPSLTKLSQLRILQQLGCFNTINAAYVAAYVIGAPMLLIGKLTFLLMVSLATFKTSARDRANSSNAENDSVIQDQEAILWEATATEVQEIGRMVEQAATQPNPSPIAPTIPVREPSVSNLAGENEHTSSVHQPMIASTLPTLDSALPNKKDSEKKLTRKQRKRLAKRSELSTKSSDEIRQNNSSPATTSPRVMIVHHEHVSLRESIEPASHAGRSLSTLGPTLHDQVWEDANFNENITQIDSLEEVLLSLPSSEAPQAKLDHPYAADSNQQSGDLMVASETNSSTAVSSNIRKRKKYTVKETIIDIIRWKKPECRVEENLAEIESKLTESAAADSTDRFDPPASQPPTSSATPLQPAKSPSTAQGPASTTEPLPFLLGYLSSAKRSVEKPGG